MYFLKNHNILFQKKNFNLLLYYMKIKKDKISIVYNAAKKI